MGLYGAMTRLFGSKAIYEGVTYDVVATRIFSEIDPVYNKAIYNGRFGVPSPNGQPNPKYPSSAIGYQPRYFLINGKAYPQTAPINVLVGQRTALRLLNASLNTRVPVLQGTPYLSVVGEDGNKLANPQEKYNVFLPALKTMDAIVTPTAPGKFPLYDRRLGLTNHTALGGGMLTYLNVTAP
jgi:FtsP/CotA-like multicopper oxidase with cupredoxin domain